jgi:lipopolysaccharide export system protein LptA
MYMSNWCSNLVIAGLLLAGASPLEAAPAPARSPEDRTTTITSQKMTVRNAENKAVFEGTVVLVKGALTVYSDVMVVFFKPQNAAGVADRGESPKEKAVVTPAPSKPPLRDDLPTLGNKSVNLIEATGKIVTIEKLDGKATCRKAVYFGDEDKLVLTGDPVAWEKGTRVAGEKITMYLAEDRSVVEGGSRVRIEQ